MTRRHLARFRGLSIGEGSFLDDQQKRVQLRIEPAGTVEMRYRQFHGSTGESCFTAMRRAASATVRMPRISAAPH